MQSKVFCAILHELNKMSGYLGVCPVRQYVSVTRLCTELFNGFRLNLVLHVP